MLEKVAGKLSSQILSNLSKSVSKTQSTGFSGIPDGQKLLLKGQELLANSKLGSVLAQNNSRKYVPIIFTPAKSIDEAAQFAKTKLGIFDFKVDDLEIANYVNEGIATYKNKVKKTPPVFHRVIFDKADKQKGYAMAVHCDIFNTLLIPGDFIKSDYSELFDKESTELYEILLDGRISLTQEQIAMLKKAINNPEKFDNIEKMTLESFISQICASAGSLQKRYALIIGNGQAKEFYCKLGENIPTVKEFSKLSKEKQEKLIEKLEQDGFFTYDYSGFKI